MSKWTNEEEELVKNANEQARLDGTQSGVYTKLSEQIPHSADSIRKHAMDKLNLFNVKPNIQSNAKLIENKQEMESLEKEIENIKVLNLDNYANKLNQSKITSNKLFVCGDFHFPYYNRKTLRTLINTGKGSDLLIAGDLLDWSSLASQKKRNDINEGTEDILKGLRHLIQLLLDNFNIIYLMPGNHDFRIEVMSEGKLSWKMLFIEFLDAFPERFKIIDFPRVEVNDTWLVLHPDTYRNIPGSVARSFSEITGKNVVCGHSHTTCESDAKNGKFAIDIGGCVDEELIAYRYYTCKPYGEWRNGFVIIEGEKYKLFIEENDF